MPKALLLSRQPLSSRPLQDWLDSPARDVVLFTTHQAAAGSEDILSTHFPAHRLVDDYHSWRAELEAEETARQHRVELVASTSEHDVLRAARLRERLGLPGQGNASATAYRDKVVMKRFAVEAGIRVPRFAPVDSVRDLLGFIDAHGLPVVVKPRFGAGAAGVEIVHDRQGLEDFLRRADGGEPPLVPGQWMAETFVAGDFFHVDGIMREGKVVHGWPSQYNGGIVEHLRDQSQLSSVLLAPQDPRTPVLMDVTAAMIAALPPCEHPLAFHLEAWLGADGRPVLCEIASRAGGGPIAETYEHAFGVQPAKEGLRAQCGSALTLDHQPPAPVRAHGWLVLPPRHGVFTPPPDPCPVAGAEVTVYLAAGTRSRGMDHAAQAAAQVIVAASTPEEVRARLGEAADWWRRSAAWT